MPEFQGNFIFWRTFGIGLSLQHYCGVWKLVFGGVFLFDMQRDWYALLCG